jgi:hypothetical protein
MAVSTLCPLTALVAAVTVGASACGSVSHTRLAGKRSCGVVAFSPASEDGAFEIRTSGISCSVARSVARASRYEGSSGTGGPSSPIYRFDGFTCKGRETTAALPTVRYECLRGDAKVTFNRS